MSTKNMEQTYLAHTYITGSDTEKAFLAHHGILGMKWGIRRFQNKDGTRTEAGKKRYSVNGNNKTWAENENEIRSIVSNSKSVKDAIKNNDEDDTFNAVYDEIKGWNNKNKVIDDDELVELISMELSEDLLSGIDIVQTYTKDLEEAYQKMRDNSKTDEEKDKKVSAFERARDNDLYDIDFVESIQNSKIMYDDNTKEILKEYTKYLDNPRDYIENQADKLKKA